MCTATFIPRDVGYYLAMNRDEKFSRITGLPPKRRFIDGRSVLYPSEPGGGTWISANDAGSSFALVNWYSATARVSRQGISRGCVVKLVSACFSIERAESALDGLPLARIKPFRLIGIFPAQREIVEWRWDLKIFDRKKHNWKAQQWISSGFDEPTARQIRGATFREAQWQPDSGSLDWLRRLHRSHSPHRGAFSTCVHRPDAATVSYTEIDVAGEKISMRYHPAAPCYEAAVSDYALSAQRNLAGEDRGLSCRSCGVGRMTSRAISP